MPHGNRRTKEFGFMATPDEDALIRRAWGLLKDKPLATYVREAVIEKAKEHLAEKGELRGVDPPIDRTRTAAKRAAVDAMAQEVADRALELVSDRLIHGLGDALGAKKQAG